MSAFSQRVDAALNGGMMNTEQEKPAATTAAGIGMGRESAFTRAVRNARGGTLDEVEMPQAKTPVDPEPGFWQRVFSGGKGAAKSYASGGVNAAGSAVGVMASLNDAAFNAEYGESYKAAQRSHEYWTKMLAEATTDEERQRAQTGLSVAQNALSSIESLRSTMSRDIRGAENALYETADDLSQSAAEDIAQAKQGAGKVGQFAVDVGVAGAQLAGDIGIGALTGGGALIPMAIRSFGSGTQQARQEGASLGQQVAYGAGSAALSVGIEKLSNFAKPLSKAFGAGFADDFITKLSGRLAQTAAGRMALSALGEGTEEAVETLLDPLLQRVTYDKDAAITADTLAEAGYNFLVGGTLGGILGGAGEVAAAKTPAAPNGAALGAEAAANGENATTATPAEEKAAEAIVVGERTAAAEPPADPLLAAIINTQQQKTTPQNVETPESFDSEGAGDYTGEYRGEFAADGQPLFARTRDEAQIESTDFGALKKRQDATDIKYGIGAEDSASLRNYIKATFYMLNKRMRNGEYAQDSAVVQRITSALKKFPTYAGRTYRNLAFANESEYQAFLEEYAAGNRTVLKAFTSTSKRPNGYPKFGKFVVHMALDCDSGADIAETYGMPRQQEVILLPGTEIEVVDVTTANDGNPLIIAREVANHGQGEVSADRESQRGTATDFHGGRTVGTGDGRSSAGVREAARGDAGRHGLLPERGRRDVGSVDAESSVGAAEHGFDPFTAAQNEHGTLPSGEHPVRPDDVPRSTDGTDRVSQSVVTAKGARVTPDEFVPLIENETMKGRFSFIPITNDATVQAVEDVIMRDGWEKALTDWTADVRKGKAGAQITAMGAMLYNNAVNAGQEQTALDILTDYQMAVRNTARGLQASRIMKKLTPESRLYMMERSIQNMVDNLGLDEPITLPQELVDAYTNAEDEAAADKVVDEIQQYVADQIPPTIMDKWTALRYTNMLGNFKTQVRNVAGNVGMAVVTEMKNAIAAGLEALAQGKAGRAHAILPGKALMDAARADFRTQQDEVMAGQRYADSMSEDAFARGVQEKQRIFKNPVLEGYRKATNWAMNNEHFGDAAFSRRAYARALAGYLKANNVTAEQFTDAKWQAKHGTFLDKARSFAAHEAQEATFRDHNVLSDWVSRIGRRADTPRAVRAVAEGLLPFRRTPANILVRAAEYSPLGIVKNAVDVARKAKGADISGVDIINGIAKTLTGTGIFALGMLLRNAGMLRGGDDEDEEQAAFDDLTGHQPYSLELEDGTSITLDWLTPASMPLFMGVELMDLIQDDGLEVKDLEQALTSIADPMLQMSMLQGISDTLGDLQYSQSNNLGQTVITAALGYLTQGLTNSLVGQLERTVDGGNDMTYVDPESALPAWLQRQIGAASRKVPGLDYNQIPYIDAWGREEERGDVLERAAHNLFNPAYVSKVDVDKLESELQRLYDATGDVAVLPDRAAKSFTMDGETRYLTAEEYVQFAKASGQDSYRYASEAVQSAAYKRMSDEERSELIGKLYSYAKYKAKKGIEPKYESKTYQKAREAEEKGISPVEYFAMKAEIDHDGNGSTTQSEAQRYLDGANMTRQEKAFVWTLINKDWKHNPYT